MNGHVQQAGGAGLTPDHLVNGTHDSNSAKDNSAALAQRRPSRSDDDNAPPSSAKRAPSPLGISTDQLSPARRSGSPSSPTWPFTKENQHNFVGMPSPAVPMTPSAINPLYSSDPNAGDTGRPNATAAQQQQSTELGSFAPLEAPKRPRSPLPSSLLSSGPKLSASNGLALLDKQNLRADQEAAAATTGAFDSPKAWLVYYFAFNLGLTLFNKLSLQGFPFPWSLTAIQMLSGTIGTQILHKRGVFKRAHLTSGEQLIMLAFSVLYTVNIAVSNLSLHLVTVPFHQVVRAMTPLFTIVLGAIFLRKRHSIQTYLSLVPLIAGVAFATWGDYDWTPWGMFLTLLGTLLAAIKTIVTNRVQVGRLKLHPLDLLVRMSPLAFIQCILFGWYSGELSRLAEWSQTDLTQSKAIALASNGAIAFGLNIVSFTANKKTSALTMTVAANVKQVLTIVLAVIIFNVSLNMLKAFGIILTILGGMYYAKVEFSEKEAKRRTTLLETASPLQKVVHTTS